MSRTLPGALSTAVAQTALAPVILAELDFSSGFVRVWNGVGTMVWNGKNWLGTGALMRLSPIEETREIEAVGLSLALSGVPSAMVAVAYGDFSQGRPAKVWLGALDIASGAMVSDPVAIFQGRMDTISDSDDGAEAVITVTAESNLADLKRLRARFLTDQDQQRIFPGDRSLRYLSSLQERPVYWGARQSSPPLQSVNTGQ